MLSEENAVPLIRTAIIQPTATQKSGNRQHKRKNVRNNDTGTVAPKTALPYGRDSCIAWNRCHIFMNKRGTYGIIADDLRFDTQLSNVYGNAIRAKLAAAQTTRSVAGSFSSFVTQNLQSICSLYHRHPRFFHKSSESDSIANT